MRFRTMTGIKFFRDMSSRYTLEEFLIYLKKVEGFKNKIGDIFYPYDSPEGGLKTIGYGYKIKTYKEQLLLEAKGISEKAKYTLDFMKIKMKEYDELKNELKKNI